MKSYKGKNIIYKNLTEENIFDQTKIIFEYEGYCSVEEEDDDNLYHGKGKLIEKRIDIKSNKTVDYRDGDWIREGEFDNGEFIKGKYLIPHTTKYEGIFKDSDADNDSQLNGDGIEYHFISKQNYLNNKWNGYVKGFFDLGTLIKGEVLNPSLINYSEHKGIKKIVLTGKIRRIYSKEMKSNLDLNKGEIFYENGDYYEGEIDFDLPFGKGRMTFKDGTKKSCEWFNGNPIENKN